MKSDKELWPKQTDNQLAYLASLADRDIVS